MDFAPITYVGLLVDLLQEWDRHAVYRGRQLLVPRPSPPRLPVQSVDLTLKAPRGGAPAVPETETGDYTHRRLGQQAASSGRFLCCVEGSRFPTLR